MKPKCKLGDLIRTANKKNVFSEMDTTKWYHNFYTITETLETNIPTNPINNLPGPYNDALLRKTINQG